MAQRQRSDFHRGSSRGSVRKTAWLGGATPVSTAVAGSTKVLLQSLSSAVLVAALGPESTIIRTRGRVMVFSDQAVADESQLGAIGMAVVSDQARSTGITAVPGPVTDSSWDGWFLWEPIIQRFLIGSGVGFEQLAAEATIGFGLDSKAMRKVPDDSAIVIVVESAAASAGFTITEYFRTLHKLH